jgi:CubicO group peptidase (beta-lactamase class C family)
MSGSGLSARRLDRLHRVLTGYVERGEVPGLVAVVARRGQVHVETIGTLAAGGAGGPVQRDTIFRIASVSKPIAAAAAMTLVEDCTLRLDDPVDDLLPELADRQVLRTIGSQLDDTEPASRAITLRDLLTFRLGLGAVLAPPGHYPIQAAIDESGLAGGPEQLTLTPGEYMERLGRLPLLAQPGEKYFYHTGADVLGVLLARASGQPLGEFLADRILGPLGMADTGFHVPPQNLGRLAAAYRPDQQAGGLTLIDDSGPDSPWGRPPQFPSAGGGLVSTADDLLAFGTMMLSLGRAGGRRVLSRPSVELMTTDQLTAQQRAENELFFGTGSGWGLCLNVVIRRTELQGSPGRFGWNGGTGTTFYVDPAEELIGILLTQREMTSPVPPPVNADFWTCAYQAIDD